MTNNYILLYELKDDPCNERAFECATLADARQHLRPMSDMVAWAELTDSEGNELADTGDLV